MKKYGLLIISDNGILLQDQFELVTARENGDRNQLVNIITLWSSPIPDGSGNNGRTPLRSAQALIVQDGNWGANQDTAISQARTYYNNANIGYEVSNDMQLTFSESEIGLLYDLMNN